MNTAVHRRRYFTLLALLVYLSRPSTIDGTRLPYLDGRQPQAPPFDAFLEMAMV